MTPRPLTKDIEAWDALIRLAEKSIERPARSTIELERAVRRANEAVMPTGPYTAANPYLALLNEARRFAGLLSIDRARHAGLLAKALDAIKAPAVEPACASRLDPPPPRFRADIDG